MMELVVHVLRPLHVAIVVKDHLLLLLLSQLEPLLEMIRLWMMKKKPSSEQAAPSLLRL